MVYKLEKMSYRDTGFLNNSTKEERHNIIALVMYYALERFHLSNKYVKNYNHRTIFNILFLARVLINILKKKCSILYTSNWPRKSLL